MVVGTDGDDPRKAQDFDRGERDRRVHFGTSSPCQFKALPRRATRGRADRWAAFSEDRFQAGSVVNLHTDFRGKADRRILEDRPMSVNEGALR
jgi:hypothetical protein